MKSSDFPYVIEFPMQRRGVVYVFFCAINDAEVPFYVGETYRFAERMGDYFRAQFAAPTDFKVGEAVRRLTSTEDARVTVGYRECRDPEDRKHAEAELINSLRKKGVKLLNDITGYDYRTADQDAEQHRVNDFCDELIAALRKDQRPIQIG